MPVAFLLHYEDINQWVSATAVAGGSLFVRHLGGNPLHIHLGVHHPDLVQLDPLPRKKCKQIILLPQNLEPVWMILNKWNSWRHVRHVVYLTISKWKTLGPIDSLELVELPRLPCQARFFPCKLLCWPSYLEDQPPSLFSFEKLSILGSHIMWINVMNVIIMCGCVSVLCVCCVFSHCISLHAILEK